MISSPNVRRASIIKRILFVQFTNPGDYPPLQHAGRILADSGWDVLFIGTGSAGGVDLAMPPHPRIRVENLGFCAAGWWQKAHYARFASRVMAAVRRWRPAAVYVSDPLGAPVGLLLSALLPGRVIYHEHDSPSPAQPPRTRFERIVLRARRGLAARAKACVLPNEERRQLFQRSHSTAKTVVVWNCPSVREVSPPKPAPGSPLVLHYHGSLRPQRVPVSLVEAISRVEGCVLRVIGYETGGAKHGESLRFRARELGVSARVHVDGPYDRQDLLAHADAADIGWAAVTAEPRDVNIRHLLGASNKVFDYLARGLAVLVSKTPDWTGEFVDPGYGMACDPHSVDDIADALSALRSNPARGRTMGELGRQRVLRDWNYEFQFEQVRLLVEGLA